MSLNYAIELIGGFAGRDLQVIRLAMQDGDVRDTGADTRRAERDLAYRPRTPFEDGLRAQFDWVAQATPDTVGGERARGV